LLWSLLALESDCVNSVTQVSDVRYQA